MRLPCTVTVCCSELQTLKHQISQESAPHARVPHAGAEAVLKTTVDPLLAKAGVALRESCKPAYAPPSLVRVVDWLHREVWDDVETELREEFLEEHGQAQKHYRELKLTAWNGPPPFWPRPHYWLRAKLLHTLEPADRLRLDLRLAVAEDAAREAARLALELLTRAGLEHRAHVGEP